MADTPKHSVSVAGIVVREDGRILAIQRRDNQHWEPPGGVLELDETFEAGVRREVLEETGVVVGEVHYFGSQPWPLPASLMVGFVARATSTEITVDEDEIEDAQWFTRAEMREQAESGAVVLPGGISISRSLVEHWYGGPLPGSW